MEFVVYILYSSKFDMTYVGYTTSIIDRFKSNNYLAKKGFTLKYRPWEVVYIEFFNNKSQAMKRELWLKSGIGRDFIFALKNQRFVVAN